MKNMKKAKKKEFFTFMFLPGPFKRVRTISISKGILKSIFFSFLAILVLSFYLFYEYNSMKDNIYEITAITKQLRDQQRLSDLDTLMKKLQSRSREIESNRYFATALEPGDLTPIFFFMGCLTLIAVVFFAIMILRRKIASSQSAILKRKLVEEFRSALDNSPLKPTLPKGPNYDR